MATYGGRIKRVQKYLRIGIFITVFFQLWRILYTERYKAASAGINEKALFSIRGKGFCGVMKV